MSGISSPGITSQDRSELTSLDGLGVATTGQFVVKTGADAYGYGTAIVSMNGLTGATQTFAVGTSGADFGVSSSGTAHTFNIPDAGASARGLVTTGAQTFGGAKTLSQVFVSGQALTAGTLTAATSAEVRRVWHKFSWTNAMVAALGAATTGDLAVCTLPAKTVVLKAVVVITGQGAGLTACTVGLGRAGALYVDYVVASSIKAAANTVYGQAFADLGANLSALVGDLPSIGSTTAVKLHFISSIENLSNVTGSTGDVYLETTTLP